MPEAWEQMAFELFLLNQFAENLLLKAGFADVSDTWQHQKERIITQVQEQVGQMILTELPDEAKIEYLQLCVAGTAVANPEMLVEAVRIAQACIPDFIQKYLAVLSAYGEVYVAEAKKARQEEEQRLAEEQRKLEEEQRKQAKPITTRFRQTIKARNRQLVKRCLILSSLAVFGIGLVFFLPLGYWSPHQWLIMFFMFWGFFSALVVGGIVNLYGKKTKEPLKYLPCPNAACRKSILVFYAWQCEWCRNKQVKERYITEKCGHCVRELETIFCDYCGKELVL